MKALGSSHIVRTTPCGPVEGGGVGWGGGGWEDVEVFYCVVRNSR